MKVLKMIVCVVGAVSMAGGISLLPFGDGVPARTTSFFYKTVELGLDAKTGLIMFTIGAVLAIIGIFSKNN